MARARKREIEAAGESGLALDPSDIARVSRDKRTVTLRHAWPESVDARVWTAVRSAFARLARQLARETGRPVEVYDPGGWLIDTYEPESQ